MKTRKLAFMASLGYARMAPQEVVASLARLGYKGRCSVEFESFAYCSRVLKGDAEEAAWLLIEKVW
jgi:hypothetical protein